MLRIIDCRQISGINSPTQAQLNNLQKDMPMATNPPAGQVAARFTDQVAIVTGGAGGLGRQICLSIGAEGGKVAVFDTNAEAIDQTVALLNAGGTEAVGHLVDVRDHGTVTSAVAAVATYFGRIDILIAAAGGSLATPRDLADIATADLDLVIDVNVKGTFNCAQAVVPHLLRAGGGAIVTFSSIGGRSTSPVTGVPYAAAKAAILGLTRRLAREVGPGGIRVNAVAPGLFLTGRLQGMFDDMTEADRSEVLDGIPLGRMPQLQECVDPVLFLASGQSSYITGAVLDVNGGRFMAG